MRTYFYAAVAFFAALHAYLVVYVNSSVLEYYFGEHGVLGAYLLSALLSLIGFYAANHILSKIGNRRFLTLVCFLDAGALLVIALSLTPLLTGAALLMHLIMVPLVGYSLDVFFEQATTTESETGFMRGLFLTSGNTALVIAPLAAGLAINAFGTDIVYLVSFLCLLLFLCLMLVGTHAFRDPHYKPVSYKALKDALHGPLGTAIAAQVTLRVFFGWIPVYLPLYLTQYLGFSWSEVGIIFAISLLPFALFELPLGKIEDCYIGEKEVMIFGFLLISASIISLSLPLTFTLIPVAIILFLSRVGASMVEIGTEAHFFRNVTAKNTEAITLFRMTQPFGILLGVSIAFIFIQTVSYPMVFAALGGLVLLGVIPAMRMIDSR